MREYAVRDKEGKVIRSGIRDANLDKGWLLSPPQALKVFCRWCDRWHDQAEDIAACRQEKDVWEDGLAQRTQKEVKDDAVASLEQQVADLTALVKQLMEGNHGGVLQPAITQSGIPQGGVPPQEPGEGEGGV